MNEQPGTELMHTLQGNLRRQRRWRRVQLIKIIGVALVNAVCVLHIAANFKVLIGAFLPGPLGQRNVPNAPMALSLLFSIIGMYAAAHFLKRWIAAYGHAREDYKQLKVEYAHCMASSGELSLATLDKQQGELTTTSHAGTLEMTDHG